MIISNIVKTPVVLFALFSAGLSTQTPAQTPEDLARGEKLYDGHCSLCHGQTGGGGKGPNLAQPVLRHAPTVERLAEVIKEGLPGTEMPGAWQLTDREAMQVALYVRSLGRTAIVKLPGDPARGRTLYDSKGGCASCHIVQGAGASLGPELTDVGARRNAEYLRQTLLKPAATAPEAFLVVRVTTHDGKTIRGIRVNEDTFTIQLRDAANHFYSFRKSSLTNLEKQVNQSLMPSFESAFTPAELDDLIAYLASLRGQS
jgi:putative heme-binding domain-containing protein